MKKHGKTLLLALVLVCSLLMAAPASAAVKMPSKSATLVKRISDYSMYLICYQPQSSWTKVKMGNETYFDALRMVCADEKKLEFQSAKQIQSLCQKYFGKNGYKDVTINGYFSEFAGVFYPNAGDWGISEPTCKITKKKQVKAGVYDIYVTNSMKNSEDGSVTKEGESVIRIKKQTGSAFGYVVTGMKYRTTNQETIDYYNENF